MKNRLLIVLNVHKVFPVMLLLITYCITSAIFPLFHSLELRQIKQTAVYRMQMAKKKDLVSLTFSEKESDQLLWEHSREFEYKGQMFDVIYKKQNGDTITYYCYADHKENKVKQKWNRLLGKEKNREQHSDQKTKKRIHFVTGFFHEYDTVVLLVISFMRKTELMIRTDEWHSSYHPSPVVPPPEHC